MSMRRVVASARAFISPKNEGGGNPVNIFSTSAPTTSNERMKLAQTCPWESIVIENETDSSDGSLPTFHFYMPSGEEVSFCGHAAIGACTFLANKASIISHEKNFMLSSVKNVAFLTAAEGLRYDALVTRDEVELVMDTQHFEAECNSPTYSLAGLLSEMGLEMTDIPSTSESGICWPAYINSSVARPKTLIPIATLERLHAATPPQNTTTFCQMCDSIDSTGVYLYSTFTESEIKEASTKKRNLAFECRQFPRSSGYPEDPATGIAAGALAASLHKRQIMSNEEESGDSIYDVFQGTAMERPSKIRVKIGDYASGEKNPSLKVSYTGLVVFDSLSYSELE